MQIIRPAIFATAMAVSAISLGGCATKVFVREQVAAEDTKVQSTQSQVNQHETHLSQLVRSDGPKSFDCSSGIVSVESKLRLQSLQIIELCKGSRGRLKAIHSGHLDVH